jgi:hypothetical protein
MKISLPQALDLLKAGLESKSINLLGATSTTDPDSRAKADAKYLLTLLSDLTGEAQ